jgi:hypothetical protein
MKDTVEITVRTTPDAEPLVYLTTDDDCSDRKDDNLIIITAAGPDGSKFELLRMKKV